MNQLRTIIGRVEELLSDDLQSDECNVIELIVTPQHYKYFLEEHADAIREWESLLSDGMEIGFMINNEKYLIALITVKAMVTL